jgi:tetratricopeptide (TPR) repeat protein
MVRFPKRLAAALLALALTGGPALARGGASQLAPADSLAGNYLAGLVANGQRDTAAAALFLREAHRADPRNLVLLESALLAQLADGSISDAMRLAERLIQRESANPVARLALGARAIKNRQFQTAREHLAKLSPPARRGEPDLTASLLTAWTYVGGGETRRALEIVDRFGDERLAGLRNYFGGLMADVGNNRPEALKRLRAAYGGERVSIRVADAYARLEARAGNRDAALAVYRELGEFPPNQPFVSEALKLLEAGGTPPPMVQNVVEGAGDTLYNLGSNAANAAEDSASVVFQQLAYLQLSLYLHPQNELALMTLAETMEEIKQGDRAIELYSRIPETSGLRLRGQIRAAYAHDALGRTDEAIRLLEAQATATPGNIDVLTALSGLHRAKKRWPEAIEAMDRAIAALPAVNAQHWNLFYARGIAYERNKQWPKAEADLKRALELLPTDRSNNRNRAQVLNYLAYSWVDQGLNIDQSFEMLKQAVALTEGRDGYIVDSLGWAYFKLGKYEDAVRELERAVELRPGDPVINDHLGDAYWRVGRLNEARFKWTHARDLKPEPDELASILRKLERGLEEPPAADAGARPSGG